MSVHYQEMKEIATFCKVVQTHDKIMEFLMFMRRKYSQCKLSPSCKKLFIRKEIIPIAAYLGYYFTVDEFLSYEEKVIKLYDKSLLSDKSLEDISGGFGTAVFNKTSVSDDVFLNLKYENQRNYDYSSLNEFEDRNELFYQEDEDLSSTRIKENNIVYDVDMLSMTAKVVRCSVNADDHVILPKVLQGKYLVTQINSRAFCAKKIISIFLPDSVKIIEDYAFEKCVRLKYFSGGINLLKIGEGAFEGCRNLEIVDTLGEITHINKNTFKNCRSLDYINIGRKVVFIHETAFLNCINISHVCVSKDNLSYEFRNDYGLYEIYDPAQILIKVDLNYLEQKKNTAKEVYKYFEKLKKDFSRCKDDYLYDNFSKYCIYYMNKACGKKPSKVLNKKIFEKRAKDQVLLYSAISSRKHSERLKKGAIYISSRDLQNSIVCANYNLKLVLNNSTAVMQMYFLPSAKIISQDEIDDIKYFIEKIYYNEGYADIYNNFQILENLSSEMQVNSILLNNDILIAAFLSYDAIVINRDNIEEDRGDGIFDEFDARNVIIINRKNLVVCEEDIKK